MRPIDLRHLGREHVICCWETDGILVDPGPQSCEATLLEALGGARPRAVLLTHIHLDHGGVTGSLVARWPGLPVFVHERGAPHLIDPGKLVASSARLYGEEHMQRLWGEVLPVPAEALQVLTGGETLFDGAFRVAHTPGHASHHVSYLHEADGTALVGDVAGVRLPGFPLTLAPTVPPELDVEAWERSLDLVAGWRPARLAITHYGAAEDPELQLEACRTALREHVRLAERTDAEGFVAALRERAHAEAGPAADALLQAAPPELLYLGLERWQDRRKAA